MNTKIYRKIAFVISALALAIALGWGFSFVSKKLGIEQKQASIQEENASFLFAILGGYGNVVADFVWIRSYIYWEQKDLANCVADMDLALAINPNNKTFWSSAYSTLAYDSPRWIEAERGSQNISQIERIQARKAIKYLERALEYHPHDRNFSVDIATIYAQKLGDLKTAISYYEKLCAREDGLVYTRRNYAELLAQDGQNKKAIEILEDVLSKVEKDSPIYRELSLDIAELRR